MFHQFPQTPGSNAQRVVSFLMIGALCLVPAIASADEPLTQAKQWSGTIDFFATGTTLVDRSGGSIKGLLSPASVDVTEASIPAGVVLENAYVYWTGTRVQGSSACAPGTINDTGNIKPPGASAFTSVTAKAASASTASMCSTTWSRAAPT